VLDTGRCKTTILARARLGIILLVRFFADVINLVLGGQDISFDLLAKSLSIRFFGRFTDLLLLIAEIVDASVVLTTAVVSLLIRFRGVVIHPKIDQDLVQRKHGGVVDQLGHIHMIGEAAANSAIGRVGSLAPEITNGGGEDTVTFLFLHPEIFTAPETSHANDDLLCVCRVFWRGEELLLVAEMRQGRLPLRLRLLQLEIGVGHVDVNEVVLVIVAVRLEFVVVLGFFATQTSHTISRKRTAAFVWNSFWPTSRNGMLITVYAMLTAAVKSVS